MRQHGKGFEFPRGSGLQMENLGNSKERGVPPIANGIKIPEGWGPQKNPLAGVLWLFSGSIQFNLS